MGGYCISAQSGLSDLLIEAGCVVKVIFIKQEGDYNHYRNTSEGIPFEIKYMYIADDENQQKYILNEVIDDFDIII